ncbi:MAG: phosphoribosyl-AMP cyclohydrolase [Alphaproteobacteria bacterium]|nr:phosphoribosyl-AMP cyclohydrolase [Alphaproteobacteria bacterium]
MNPHAQPEVGSTLANAIQFNEAGLVPVVVQQVDSGQVLMLAWMNRAALARTLATGEAHFFSRSRGFQWHKGESSGFTQRVIEIRLDCDGDALLLLVQQKGVACHTGRMSCWFFTVRDGKLVAISEPEVDPATMASESHH